MGQDFFYILYINYTSIITSECAVGRLTKNMPRKIKANFILNLKYYSYVDEKEKMAKTNSGAIEVKYSLITFGRGGGTLSHAFCLLYP